MSRVVIGTFFFVTTCFSVVFYPSTPAPTPENTVYAGSAASAQNFPLLSLNTHHTPSVSSVYAAPARTNLTFPPTAVYTNRNVTGIDARFTGLLLHIRYLVSLENENSETSRLNKQIFSVMDDIDDEFKDLREEIGDSDSGSGFEASDIDTSAELAAILTDETGNGVAVFSASPTLTGTLTAATTTLSGLLTMSGSAANIALGANYLSNDGSDEGISIDSYGNVVISHVGESGFVSAPMLSMSKTTTVESSEGGIGTLNASILVDPVGNAQGVYAGNFSASSQSGNNFNITNLDGISVSTNHDGGGILASNRGVSVALNKSGVGTITDASVVTTSAYIADAGGLLTNLKLLEVGSVVNSGTITNTYGLYVGDITTGTQTNTPFSIYVSDDNAHSYFAGYVGIGTTTPAQKLQVFGNIRVGTTGSNGCLEDFSGGLIAGTCSSDENLKKNIEPIAQDGRSYIESLAALTPVTYNWNEVAGDLYSKDTKIENLGLIAQDVESQFPELVSLNDEGYKQVDFRTLPFYMIEALKELWAKVKGHDERLEQLEQENEYLKDRIESIEDELNITPEPISESFVEEVVSNDSPIDDAIEEVSEPEDSPEPGTS